MGFIDEFTGFVGEVNSLKQNVTQFGTDFIHEALSEAEQVKQTVTGAADEIKTTASDMSQTIKQSTALTTETPDDTQHS